MRCDPKQWYSRCENLAYIIHSITSCSFCNLNLSYILRWQNVHKFDEWRQTATVFLNLQKEFCCNALPLYIIKIFYLVTEGVTEAGK
jgi:hypothetical protein